MPDHLTPIKRTLLQLLRVPDSPQELPTPAGLTDLDWEMLLTEAGHHDIIPLLNYRLQALSQHKAEIPAQILEHVCNTSLKNSAYTSLLYLELQQILSACEREGILVILLKGAYLAKEVYPEIGLRPMCDLDLMVHSHDLTRAAAITEKLGYTASYSHSQENEMAFHHHMPMYKKGNIFGVEWHWHISKPESAYHIKLDELWERAIPVEIAGIPCFGLAHEDLFLHLALHLTGQHICSLPLRSLVDIDMLLRMEAQRLDWQAIIERARRWRMERCVYLTLRLATECFGTAVPDGVLSELVPEHVEDDVMDWAYEQLFNAPVPKPERVITKFVHFWQEQSIMKRLRMLWGRVFLSRRELSRQVGVHPDTLALWRYYPLRFWILIRRYGRQVLRLWLKDQDQLAVLEQHSNQNNLERWLSG